MDHIALRHMPGADSKSDASLCAKLKAATAGEKSHQLYDALDAIETHGDARVIQPFFAWSDADWYSGDLDIRNPCPPGRASRVKAALLLPGWPAAISALERALPEGAKDIATAFRQAVRAAQRPSRREEGGLDRARTVKRKPRRASKSRRRRRKKTKSRRARGK